MPDWKSEIRTQLAALKLDAAREAEIIEELSQHLEDRFEELCAQGATEEGARRRVVEELSGGGFLSRELRRVEHPAERESAVMGESRGNILGSFWQDLRYAARMLRKNPGFTAVAVLTLALGIGANTAIFSVVNSVLLRPLPFDQPEQLVQLWEGPPGSEIRVSGPTFGAWNQADAALERLAAYSPTALNLTGRSMPERLRGLRVSAEYLRVFRITPVLGRDLRPEEDQPGNDKVVILTHGLWQRSFGGAADLVGRTIPLGGEARTVIGILPAEPVLLAEYEFLVPLALGGDAHARNPNDRWLRVVARLKPGVTIEQARAALSAALASRVPRNPPIPVNAVMSVVPLDVQMTGEYRPKLWILFGAVGFLLLIACANVAGLLLARGTARRTEVAIRAALGADRWRIGRQLLTESLLLSWCGGAIGTLLASWGTEALIRGIAIDLPRATEIGLDSRALLFALVTSLLTGLFFGLAPVWQAGRADLRCTITKGVGTARVTSVSGLRGGLIVAQVAVALVLLTGAGLMVRSLWQLTTTSPGFDAKDTLGFSVSLDGAKYPDQERRVLFWDELARRLESLPGVESVGMAGGLPLNEWNNTTIRLGERAGGTEAEHSVDYEYVGGSYFHTLRIPVLQGRVFGPGDSTQRSPRTAILSASLARRAFPDNNAVGRRVTVFGEPREIVGVTGEVRQHGIDQGARDCIYLPQAFAGVSSRRVMVRTKVPPLTLASTIRSEILAIDANQPVSNLRTLEQVVNGSFADRRLMLILLALFAAAALSLAAMGLCGVLAFSVSQRTREIGIRMALGAQRRDVLLQVMRQGLTLTLLGMVIGILGALALTRVLSHLLFEVAPTDPITFAGVAFLLAIVALVACWLPSRRATKVDPIVALRCE
jgi:predicted permease